jgi:hypothetical protein
MSSLSIVFLPQAFRRFQRKSKVRSLKLSLHASFTQPADWPE